jgi:hypothetical protein
MKNTIMEVLEKYKKKIEERGHTVYAIALKGSQNYNLDDAESDIDANAVLIPTLKELRENKSVKFSFEEGEVVCHNIYSFAEIVAKGNPQWVEVCNTEYIIGDLSMFKTYTVNPSALKGMCMEKVHAFSKLYPSRAKYVKEFGYDPKQLHHIIRLVDILEKDVSIYKYTENEKIRMLDIKRGRFPETLKEAEDMKTSYVDRLNKVYESRKLAYTKQNIDYNILDNIVLTYLCKKKNYLTKG